MKRIFSALFITVLASLTIAAEANAETTYMVARGDCLSAIGAKLKVSWREIARTNRLRSPYLILVGQSLKIPGGAIILPPSIVEKGQNSALQKDAELKIKILTEKLNESVRQNEQLRKKNSELLGSNEQLRKKNELLEKVVLSNEEGRKGVRAEVIGCLGFIGFIVILFFARVFAKKRKKDSKNHRCPQCGDEQIRIERRGPIRLLPYSSLYLCENCTKIRIYWLRGINWPITNVPPLFLWAAVAMICIVVAIGLVITGSG